MENSINKPKGNQKNDEIDGKKTKYCKYCKRFFASQKTIRLPSLAKEDIIETNNYEIFIVDF